MSGFMMFQMKYILLLAILVVAHHSVLTQYSEQEDALNYMHFSLNSYKAVHDINTNFVYSPLSLSVIYNILYQISSGNAEARLHEILFPITRIRPSKYDILQSQVDSLALIMRNPSIKLANKFYLNNNTAFDTIFKYLADRYQTASETIDFSRIEQARNDINKWVESRTNRKIENLVEIGQISQYTNMIITNTIYFKAEWLRKYSELHVSDGIFNSIHGSASVVKFINDTQMYDISFRPLLGIYALRLPYKTGFELWIILPFANYVFENFVQSLTADTMYDIKQNFQKIHSQIKFPLFTIETRVNGKVAKPEAFANQDFQFSRGAQTSVSDIIQKMKITVNTDGTEAASGIYIPPVGTSRLAPPEPFYFIADRPFVYTVIADGNLPIIIGHYTS